MIDFDGVSKRYGRKQRPALDDVTLTITDGEFAFLVGASGSGKSTMLRLVLCEERPSQGRITVAGREVTSMRRRQVPGLRRDIGMVFQMCIRDRCVLAHGVPSWSARMPITAGSGRASWRAACRAW